MKLHSVSLSLSLCVCFLDSLAVNSETGLHRFLNILTPQLIQLWGTIHFASFTLPDNSNCNAVPLEDSCPVPPNVGKIMQ